MNPKRQPQHDPDLHYFYMGIYKLTQQEVAQICGCGLNLVKEWCHWGLPKQRTRLFRYLQYFKAYYHKFENESQEVIRKPRFITSEHAHLIRLIAMDRLDKNHQLRREQDTRMLQQRSEIMERSNRIRKN